MNNKSLCTCVIKIISQSNQISNEYCIGERNHTWLWVFNADL